MIEKRNFKFNDMCYIDNINTTLLGQVVTIVGIASKGVVDIYIVELPSNWIQDNLYPWTHATIPETCLIKC